MSRLKNIQKATFSLQEQSSKKSQENEEIMARIKSNLEKILDAKQTERRKLQGQKSAHSISSPQYKSKRSNSEATVMLLAAAEVEHAAIKRKESLGSQQEVDHMEVTTLNGPNDIFAPNATKNDHTRQTEQIHERETHPKRQKLNRVAKV